MSTTAQPPASGPAADNSQNKAPIRDIASFKTIEQGFKKGAQKMMWTAIREHGDAETENEASFMTYEQIHLILWTARYNEPTETTTRKGTLTIHYKTANGDTDDIEFVGVFDEVLHYLNEMVQRYGFFEHKTVDEGTAKQMVNDFKAP